MSTLATGNREALYKEIFKKLAEALDLRHPDRELIEAAFETLDSGAAGRVLHPAFRAPSLKVSR